MKSCYRIIHILTITALLIGGFMAFSWPHQGMAAMEAETTHHLPAVENDGSCDMEICAVEHNTCEKHCLYEETGDGSVATTSTPRPNLEMAQACLSGFSPGVIHHNPPPNPEDTYLSQNFLRSIIKLE
ncbi:MAG: hypothetical protein NUV82_03535 [Candidatus Komeilibacteria bacterium]|nr:hypothetical protein [Candidatus Komeilibacteria bacterium]